VLNNAAKINSPLVSVGSTGLCFQFFYHMYGTNINTLNVYTKQNGNLGKAVWQKIGEQGNKWILGQVYLELLSNFQFVIEGVAGNGARLTNFSFEINILIKVIFYDLEVKLQLMI
jgi:hypothetical protein